MFFLVAVSNYYKDLVPIDLSQDDQQGKFLVCYRNCWKPNMILDFMRVCGSDSKTYRNNCDLENAACLNPKMKIVMNCYGRCPCRNTNQIQWVLE